MSRVTLIQRLYLAAVAFLAITVGFWCYIEPSQSANGIPWTLPPLCATFLGSMYLSGAVYAVICILSRRWGEIQLFMPQCALWTGGLAIVSLRYIPAFDFSRHQTLFWWLAYIVFPIVAVVLLIVYRAEWHLPLAGDTSFPGWAQVYLRAQGSVMVTLGLALLFAPEFMQTVWPWKTGVMMLQLYSMPLLAYGIGSWLMARSRGWAKIRNALLAQAVFTSAELFASLRYLELLNGPAISVGVWLAALAVMTGMMVVLIALALGALHRKYKIRKTIPAERSLV